MKKREIRIPPLPPRQKGFLRNQKAFFCFWSRGRTKNSLTYKFLQKAAHEDKAVQEPAVRQGRDRLPLPGVCYTRYLFIRTCFVPASDHQQILYKCCTDVDQSLTRKSLFHT